MPVSGTGGKGGSQHVLNIIFFLNIEDKTIHIKPIIASSPNRRRRVSPITSIAVAGLMEKYLEF
jgi:hypothetical protein